MFPLLMLRCFLVVLGIVCGTCAFAESTCFGTTNHGKIAGSVQLPEQGSNFSAYSPDGKFEEYSIDFEAIGEHLYQLGLAAQKAGVSIAIVIFDPPYLPKLFATPHGNFLRQNLNFMKGNAWVRHDEHYHVDFSVPCKPFVD